MCKELEFIMINMSNGEADFSGLMFSSSYRVTDATARMVTRKQDTESLPMPKGVVIGQEFGQFGQLTVLGRVSNDGAGRVRLQCQCKCGRKSIARLSDLRRGHTKSCGCLRAAQIRHRLGKIVLHRFGLFGVLGKSEAVHGVTPSTEWVAVCLFCGRIHFKKTYRLRRRDSHCECLDYTYASWRNMIQRCTNPNHEEYHRYGGRGITVCPEWRKSFTQFVLDKGKRPKGETIDRYPDPNGPYTPANTEWATREQQAQNR